MTSLLFPVAWAVLGAGAGLVIRQGSVWLARLEGLEPGSKPWQVWGPPILSALLFAVFAAELEMAHLLVLGLRSVFILVLVQVIFFDFEHRLILDRVIFPAMVLALLASLLNEPWWAGIATGVAAGLVFFLLSLAGSALLKADALGFGDVKLVAFMGLLLGPLPTLQALFYGVFLAGLVSVGVAVWQRSLRGTIAYGPYLAAGALIALYLLH